MNYDQIAKKIKAKDGKAFEALYEDLRVAVYSTCLSIVRSPATAEEVTQDTFVAVWTKSNEFRGVGYKTWILTIAKHKSLNEIRKRKREVFTDFAENESLAGTYDLENEELGFLLRGALKTLNETDARIVLMKNAGVKTHEIAKILEMPRGTVSWRYSVALQTLKKYVKENDV